MTEGTNGVSTAAPEGFEWKNPPGIGEFEFINPKTLLEQGITGEVLVGTLLEVIENQFGGIDYRFKRQSDGASVILNGCGSLKLQLAEVAPGTLVNISYFGKEKLASGRNKGKESHKFKVLVAG